ncbi:bifunctional demethylmenaquinone methyltransferase/2-methoxy-6-polyprenyl-1,4-benzoquinol methylase UbiE [Aphanothece hegewaldii CCALA 016]|uniref:2-phytyl-1,4-naphtoquinone methyltransferase n=1 Tax=Aphanothece hegewaldii CCALA 016 TaxID=2107694 RepID=A0A2T1LXG8_9CHRO|nr:bifunctional demethylmenaquinone methyltransferase/2-methoxy-6-polyprenyl-1,4-benzoquinol methylase UbiE [Aphanothece hegewaldii]PSF37084.1 bifunctional demethylmenaquinone methyltransferase/2-methoxy-6-polyprenyl-1,4-benzoquinol methylase UbiE [Aphanothece hegewaldii CCALA 016]
MTNTQVTASEVQAIFNRLAPVYDQFNQSLSFGLHRIWKLMTVKWCQPKLGDVGLDVCCGTGDLTQLLAQQVGKTGKVIGLDFSVELLAIAQQRATQNTPQLPLEWIEGDALNLPFGDQTFDCATMGYGLRNVTDITQCLKELYRVLKPSAKVAILDFHRPHQPLIRSFQQWYLNQIVVEQAKRFDLTDEYAYISPSVDRFPVGTEQVKLGYNTQFSHAVHYPIAGGLMGVLVLTK